MGNRWLQLPCKKAPPPVCIMGRSGVLFYVLLDPVDLFILLVGDLHPSPYRLRLSYKLGWCWKSIAPGTFVK